MNLHPQSGWPQVAPPEGGSSGRQFWIPACAGMTKLESRAVVPAKAGTQVLQSCSSIRSHYSPRIGRTYPGPPPEVEGLMTTKVSVFRPLYNNSQVLFSYGLPGRFTNRPEALCRCAKVPFLSYRGSRPAHFKELRTGDARPLRLTARDCGGQCLPPRCSPRFRSGPSGPPFRNSMK